MKLFGGSKNGKHTGDGPEHQHHERERDLDETVYFDSTDLRQAPPQTSAPAEETPVPLSGPEESAPVPDAPPERPVPIERDSTAEEGFINSIVEAIDQAEQNLQPLQKQDQKQKTSAHPQTQEAAHPVSSVQPPEKKKMSGGKKAGIIIGSIVGVIVLIVLAVLVVLKLWITAPDMNDGLTVPPTPSQNVTDGPDNDTPPDNTSTGNRKSDVCRTFLIAGVDVASGSTDVLLVGKIDSAEGTLNVVSIPRDTLINWSGANKINSAYAADKNTGGNGVDGLLKEIEKILGFAVDSYAIVDTVAVEELIDAIGGVTYNVPQNMDYDDPIQDLHIHIKAGEQKLSGADAVKVLRFRGDYAGGDIQRIGVQQDFFKSLAKQMLSLGNIPNLNEALKIYEKRVVTNLDVSNVAWYLGQFLTLDMDHINFYTLPGDTNGSINGTSFVFININEWLEMVNDYLNPFKVDVTEYNVSIKTYGSGGYIYSAGASN